MNKIPPGSTIAYAYNFTFTQLGTIIGLAWLPLVISAILQFLPYAVWSHTSYPENATAQGREALESLLTALLVLLLNAIIFVPVVRQALGLRRGPALVHLRLGVAEFRLFGALLLFLLVMMMFLFALRIVEYAAGMLPPRGPLLGGLAVLIVLAAGLAFLYVMIRLGFMILPVTVAEEQVSLTRCWALTKANFWRILAVLLAIGIPLAIAYSLVVVGIIGPGRLFAPLPADSAEATRALNARLLILQQHMPLYIGLNLIIAPFAIGLNAGATSFAYRVLVPAQSQNSNTFQRPA